MSRAGSALFGKGDLDEVALYNRALTPATIADALRLLRHQPPADRRASRPTPNPVATGSRSPSTPRPRAIPTARSPNTNGTSTATAPTRPTRARPRRVTKTYATEATVDVGLRVTDNRSGTDTRRRTDRCSSATSRRRRRSRPRRTRRSTARRSRFNAAGSTRPRRHDHQVRVGPRRQRHATRPTRARPRRRPQPYTDSRQPHGRAAGHRQRRRDRHHDAARSPSTAAASPATATRCCDTPGLVDYWRLGETAGTTLADSEGHRARRRCNGGTLRRARRDRRATRTPRSRFDGDERLRRERR